MCAFMTYSIQEFEELSRKVARLEKSIQRLQGELDRERQKMIRLELRVSKLSGFHV